jgi:hypothetical protein
MSYSYLRSNWYERPVNSKRVAHIHGLLKRSVCLVIHCGISHRQTFSTAGLYKTNFRWMDVFCAELCLELSLYIFLVNWLPILLVGAKCETFPGCLLVKLNEKLIDDLKQK